MNKMMTTQISRNNKDSHPRTQGKPMFFPFCCAPSPEARRQQQQFKLEMMKAFRDSLETRLAALNAAISTVEQQMRQDNEETA
jgi:hypothetical protein